MNAPLIHIPMLHSRYAHACEHCIDVHAYANEVLHCIAGSPEADAVAKRRRTVSRGRDFKVTIEFAARIRMKAIEEMMKGIMGKCTEEQEKRALDGLEFWTSCSARVPPKGTPTHSNRSLLYHPLLTSLHHPQLSLLHHP